MFSSSKIFSISTPNLRLFQSSTIPKLLICNGADVCYQIMSLFNFSNSDIHKATKFKAHINLKDGTIHEFWIGLSGLLERVDDWRKRRLGVEIEKILEEENICLK